jgi:hypothetical protein
VFLLQAGHTQHAIQQATGEPSQDQNAATDVRGGAWTDTGGQLRIGWTPPRVAMVLLSTSLSSILFAEDGDRNGVSADPGVVTSGHLCHDTISTSRIRTWYDISLVLPLIETTIHPRNPPFKLLDTFLPRIFGSSGHRRNARKLLSYLKYDLV